MMGIQVALFALLFSMASSEPGAQDIQEFRDHSREAYRAVRNCRSPSWPKFLQCLKENLLLELDEVLGADVIPINSYVSLVKNSNDTNTPR
jgi:hypothetical protein